MVKSQEVISPPCGKPFWESKSLWVFVAQEILIFSSWIEGVIDEKAFLVGSLTLLSASIMRVVSGTPLRLK